MANLHHTVALLMLAGFLTTATSAHTQSRKRLRELEKVEEKHEEDAEADNSEALARHMNIQSKSTKKEMKRYKKLSKQHNTNRRPLFNKARRRHH